MGSKILVVGHDMTSAFGAVTVAIFTSLYCAHGARCLRIAKYKNLAFNPGIAARFAISILSQRGLPTKAIFTRPVREQRRSAGNPSRAFTDSHASRRHKPEV